MNRTHYAADVVVPCFNEGEALPVTAPQILDYFRKLSCDSANHLSSFRLLLVDDGSRDNTWTIIEGLARSNSEVMGIKLSRNYGHQAAMLAGLTKVSADVAITMDADLQDEISAVSEMLRGYEGGAHIALGVRSDRSNDRFGKRVTANAYYRLLSLLGVSIFENHADFRLMSKKALDALLQYREINLFLRGIIPTLGFPVIIVPYVRKAREYGETKYTVRKMLRLAMDGVSSFTIMPLRLIALIGGGVFFVSMLLGLFFLIERLFLPQSVVPGWASTVVPLTFLGGMQILAIGVIGEYVGKIYTEVKRRPRFIVEESTGCDR